MKIRQPFFCICFFALSFVLFPLHISFANDAPIKVMSGNATPIDSFWHGPSDISVNVQMVSEVVSIYLEDNSYIVDATFNFYNPTEKTEKILVGFPKRSEEQLGSDGSIVYVDKFTKFEAWINTEKAEIKEIPGRSSIEAILPLPDLLEAIKTHKTDAPYPGMMIGHDSRWMAKEVSFAPKKKTTTRVRYEALYQDFGNCHGARYIYGTGTYWKGNIRNSKFIINCNATEGPDMCSVEIGDKADGKKYKVKQKRIKKNVTQYEINNYKPDEDAQVTVLLGCPD